MKCDKNKNDDDDDDDDDDVMMMMVTISVFFKIWLEEPLSNFERPKDCS